MTDAEILNSLARYFRKTDALSRFLLEDADADRCEVLIEWFAESVDVLNVPRLLPPQD